MGGKNKKTAEKVSNAPKKRAGPKGNFLGLCLEYLETELTTYLSHHADRYLSMYFVYLMCSSVGLLLNHDNLVAANAILGLVPMAA